MINRQEIEKLANLSRLKLSPEEMGLMESDMSSILAYVDKLKEAKVGEAGPVMSVNKNVMREDANPHEGGVYTDKLVNLSPRHEDNLIKVKKIL